MPELPEVETISNFLRPELIGRRIISERLLWKRTLASPSPKIFASRIVGQTIRDVFRRGKFFGMQLSNQYLFIHLRMSGDLTIKPESHQPDTHDRLLLGLSEGRFLVFNDPRKFGRVWLTEHPQEVIGNLGPEPFDPGFTPSVLFDRLHRRRRQIKSLLLDQSFLAGLGNIYTDEALHLSGIHPLRLSDTISLLEAEKLYNSILTVLQTGIKHNGASIDWVYRGGNFQNYFRVYGRVDQPCPVCGTLIERTVVGQRGTYFCPNCQTR